MVCFRNTKKAAYVHLNHLQRKAYYISVLGCSSVKTFKQILLYFWQRKETWRWKSMVVYGECLSFLPQCCIFYGLGRRESWKPDLSSLMKEISFLSHSSKMKSFDCMKNSTATLKDNLNMESINTISFSNIYYILHSSRESMAKT